MAEAPRMVGVISIHLPRAGQDALRLRRAKM